MSLKDKIKNIWIIANKHFAFPFCLSVSIVFITINIFELKFNPLSNYLVLNMGLIFGLFAFLLLFKQLDNKDKRVILCLFTASIIIMFTAQFLSNFNKSNLIALILEKYKIFENFIFYVSFIFGIILLYAQQKNIIKNALSQNTNNNKKNWHTFGILTLIIIAFFLRYYKVIDLGQSVDNFYHLISAENIIFGGENLYHRSELYTYFIAFFYKLFGVNELANYMPNFIFSLGTVGLIYFVGKKIFNKEVGIISAALLTFSFWHIGDAGNIRMYTAFTFSFLLFFYFLYELFFKTGIFSAQAKSLIHIAQKKWLLIIITILTFGITFHLHTIASITIIPIIIFIFMNGIIFLYYDLIKKNGFLQRTYNSLALAGLSIFCFMLIFFFYPNIIWQFKANLIYNPTIIDNWDILINQLRNGIGWFTHLLHQYCVKD